MSERHVDDAGVVMMSQPVLPVMPELTERTPVAVEPTRPREARVIRAMRSQVEWMPRSLDSLVAEDHPARAIWAYLERIDLAEFYGSIKAVVGAPGHPTTDPQVLLALWLLATSEGVGSARRLARLCEEHDAYRWLRGGVPINYHMLADFRVAHLNELDRLFTTILATLMTKGLVTLTRVAQDGMRVRASAGAASFRGETSLDECLVEARAQVERLAQEVGHPDPKVNRRQQAARERAAKEWLERVGQAVALLPTAQAVKARQKRTLDKPRRERVTKPRVSTTDPQAHVMHMPDGGFRPAYNVQTATDAASQVIVGLGISTRGSDQGEALSMESQVVMRTGQHPREYLIDGGYVKRDDITGLELAGVTVYAPLRPPRTTTSGREATTPRPDDSDAVIAWRERMGTEEAKTIYRQRGAIAECVHAQYRSRHGIHQFRVRGIDKVFSVMLLTAITHNLLRWIALSA